MTKKKAPGALARLGKLPEGECGLADAVRIAGSKSELARKLGLGTTDPRTGQKRNDRQVVSEWFRRGAIPRQYVLRIHELTGVPIALLLTPFPPYRPASKNDGDEANDAVPDTPATATPLA